MKIAVSAQEQELRVHLTSAVLERPEFELHMFAPQDVWQARLVGASAVLMQCPSSPAIMNDPRMRELVRAIPVVIVTHQFDRASVAKCLSHGARGALLAERSTRTIQSAIFSVLDGGSWIDPKILSALLDDDRANSPVGSASNAAASSPRVARKPLTGREEQVATLIGRGMTNSEIADCLNVDESTVKTHIGSILRKVHLRDRLQVALWFHGLPIEVPNS
ncbi:MAG TPA: hypothetical protein DCQ04_16765 [Actinobacteria bacterium]|jgi:DNA-binding NarL/FixJ family response regulator|nr:hypothetical protein [Actinomycetota bacterium]